MKLKPEVSLDGAQPVLLAALEALDKHWRLVYMKELVVTSGRDGTHKHNSLHYVGLAADLRIRNLSYTEHRRVCKDVRSILGPDWDVVDEGTHLHIEYDPKEKPDGPRTS